MKEYKIPLKTFFEVSQKRFESLRKDINKTLTLKELEDIVEFIKSLSKAEKIEGLKFLIQLYKRNKYGLSSYKQFI